jgi:hypothetical protein
MNCIKRIYVEQNISRVFLASSADDVIQLFSNHFATNLILFSPPKSNFDNRIELLQKMMGEWWLLGETDVFVKIGSDVFDTTAFNRRELFYYPKNVFQILNKPLYDWNSCTLQ